MKTISEETALLPEIIAEEITQNEDEIAYLVKRAEIHFQNSATFKKAITAKANKGRDNLYMFMEHWLDAHKRNEKRIANHFKI